VREPSKGGRGGNGGSVAERAVSSYFSRRRAARRARSGCRANRRARLAFSGLAADNLGAHLAGEQIAMLRIAVASYLMIVTAAGPWFCCCAPARFAAFLTHPCIEKPVTEQCSSCCCKHHDQGSSGPQAPDEPVKVPARPGCPCRGDSAQLIALPPALEGTNPLPIGELSERVTGVAPCFSTDAIEAPCSSSLFWGARRAHPFLSADDLLRALHNLRC
jgi:hypothetical protein